MGRYWWDCGTVPGPSDDVVIGAGTVTLTPDFTIGDLTFSGGTLTGEGDLTVAGLLTWSAGTMSGSGTTIAQGGTLFSGGVSKTIGRHVELASTTTWSNGTLAMRDGAVLVNRAGQTFTDDAVGTHSLARSGAITTEPVVINQGTWIVASGGSSTNTGFDNEGLLVVSGGGFGFIAPSVFTNTADGTIEGASELDVASGPVFANLGTTRPGTAGANPATLPVRGEFPMGADHRLEIELNGAGDTERDRATVEDGDVTVDGRLFLFVNYGAAVGQRFDVLTHTGTGTVSGCYAPQDVVVEPEGYELTVTCTSSGIGVEVTGVTAAEPDAVATGLTLSAAHPNPFSGRTTLVLSVAKPQPVEAVVFDALGRQVATLFDGLATAPLALTLDGTKLPAGVYVVRVRGEEGSLTRQVTLAR